MIRAGLLALLFALPGPLFACACCAEAGERSTITHAIQHAGNLHDAMARAKDAHLFTTACGMECVKGISPPDDQYEVSIGGEGAELTLGLQGATGSGEITLSLPGTFTQFKVDPKPEPAPNTTLYIERRFAVGLVGSGTFTTDWPLVGELVLSGFGNHCEDVSQSTHWSLDVDQIGARYRLFGAFAD